MSEYYITVRRSSSMQPKHHARLLYLVQVLKNQIMYSNFPAVLCLSCLLWHFLCSLCRVPYNYCNAQTAFRYTTSSLPLGITWRSGGIFLGGKVEDSIREEHQWNTNETPIFFKWFGVIPLKYPNLFSMDVAGSTGRSQRFIFWHIGMIGG